MHILNMIDKESYNTLRSSYPNLHLKKAIIRGMDASEVADYVPRFMYSHLGSSVPLLKYDLSESIDRAFNDANIGDVLGIFVHHINVTYDNIQFLTSIYTVNDETDVSELIKGFMETDEDDVFVVFVKKLDVERKKRIHDEVTSIAEGVSPKQVRFKPKEFNIRCWVSVRESIRSKDEILSKIKKIPRVGINLTNDRSMASNNYIMTLVDINDLNRLKLTMPEVVNGIHKIHYGMLLFDGNEGT